MLNVLTISGQLQYIIIREDKKEEDFSFSLTLICFAAMIRCNDNIVTIFSCNDTMQPYSAASTKWVKKTIRGWKKARD